MKKILSLLVLLALSPFASNAQTEREVEKTVKVYFRQGSSAIDENYMDNGATLREFASEVEAYHADTAARFRQIRILSSVSPEGSQHVNDRIARQRAEAISSWISRELSLNVDYAVESMGVDWALFTELVENNSEVLYRDEVLQILNDVPAEGSNDTRFNRIVALRGGAPYRWLSSHIFPSLRYASAECELWWEVVASLTITSVPERFACGGGEGVATYSKSVEDDVVPVVVSNDEWVTLLESPEGEIRFAVAPNDSVEPRQATLSVECYDTTQDLVVEQDGAEPVMRLTSASPVNYGAEGGADVITYETNVCDGTLPTASCPEEWIESLTTTPEGITYNVASNPSAEQRSTTILVENFGVQHFVEVNQLGAPECERPFFMSIKTNMLYDLAAIPNIGAEFYLGGNFSVAANWHYSWWKSDRKAWYWRTYGGDASIRYWLGPQSRIKPLTGHHLGLYGQMITYDFEVGNRGILADKWSWSVGAEYGYSLPIARRLNLDFTIGFGYHWGLFDEYLPIDGHYVWQATKRRRYVGPTKLEVSLVWLIGCGNYNKDKGGRR